MQTTCTYLLNIHFTGCYYMHTNVHETCYCFDFRLSSTGYEQHHLFQFHAVQPSRSEQPYIPKDNALHICICYLHKGYHTNANCRNLSFRLINYNLKNIILKLYPKYTIYPLKINTEYAYA